MLLGDVGVNGVRLDRRKFVGERVAGVDYVDDFVQTELLKLELLILHLCSVHFLTIKVFQKAAVVFRSHHDTNELISLLLINAEKKQQFQRTL